MEGMKSESNSVKLAVLERFKKGHYDMRLWKMMLCANNAVTFWF